MKKTVVSKSKKTTPAPAKKPLSKVGEYLRSGISVFGDIEFTQADLRLIMK